MTCRRPPLTALKLHSNIQTMFRMLPRPAGAPHGLNLNHYLHLAVNILPGTCQNYSLSGCSRKNGFLPSPPVLVTWREAGVKGRGNGSFYGLIPAPPIPSFLQIRHIWGGSICTLLIEMGCLACRAEDDSLGLGPGTLGKAKPASGQSPRE